MSAHSVESIVVDRPSEEVFDVVHDYGIRCDWDTLLRRAEVIGEQAPGKGVVTVCTARWYLGGLAFKTRYVTFVRPKLAAVTLLKPYFVFENWSASIRHRDIPPQPDNDTARSELTYTLTLSCRPRWAARPLEAIAIAMFALETKRRLRALKRYVEARQPGTV